MQSYSSFAKEQRMKKFNHEHFCLLQSGCLFWPKVLKPFVSWTKLKLEYFVTISPPPTCLFVLLAKIVEKSVNLGTNIRQIYLLLRKIPQKA